jgi:2,4-dienoyl-CoA reductase-like NADH-dependent reductase (Old Yellow Enzyme family)
MHLLRRIERYLRETDTPATRFGREAVRDPRFVFDLRHGREPRIETERRVLAFLEAHSPQVAPR